MAASSSSGPRYAPEDLTLPKPWRGLVDGSTGYLYFWNPETNVTQYERPIADPLPPPPPPPPLPPHAKPSPIASSVHHPRRDSKDDHDHAASRTNQSGRGSSSSHLLNGSSTAGGHSALQSTRPFARGHGSSEVGGGSSAEAYRRQHEITITGDNVPPPLTTFESTGFPAEILKEVHHAGFSAPTPIQAQSWPIALESRDIVAIAKTGSGKTLGYLIPGFIHLKRLRNNSQMGPTVLVLSPTRELATQIQDEAVKFGRSSRISCVCLYGGAPKGPQLRDLDRGADVVVATPGRLNDFLEMRRVSLRQVSYLVLDEADRMLDMGFEPQIRKIVKEIPARRQTLMFTATWPKEVRKIAADLLVNPVQVNIGSVDELVANKAITQYVEIIIPSEKQRRLEQILKSQEPGSKVIIFCSTKRMCDQLARNITRQFGAAAIHGDKSQTERDWVLSQFRTGRSPILVATDVAARGLDIKDIRVVINYDFPTGVEDYVHRIGRTGRAGATGVSYTFFSDQDSKYASDLVKVLEGADQRVPPELREMVSRGGYGGKSRRWGSGSGARDGGRSHGGGHSDSGYGGRGGRGEPPYSGRSNSGRGGRGRSPPRNRYDRSYRDEREIDAHGRRDTKSSGTTSDNRGGGKRRSRSRSFSRSPNRRHGGGWANSRSRSRSRSWNHGGHSRSRSRSRSGSRGVNRYGGGAGSAREQSLPLKREPSPGNYGTTSNAHSSPKPTFQEHKLQQLSPDNGGAMREVHPDHSPSPRKERSRSPPYKHNDNERGPGRGSASPVQNGPVQSSRGPCNNGDEEEEGMIPADEEGMICPEVGMRSSEMASEEPNSFN